MRSSYFSNLVRRGEGEKCGEGESKTNDGGKKRFITDVFVMWKTCYLIYMCTCDVCVCKIVYDIKRHLHLNALWRHVQVCVTSFCFATITMPTGYNPH